MYPEDDNSTVIKTGTVLTDNGKITGDPSNCDNVTDTTGITGSETDTTGTDSKKIHEDIFYVLIQELKNFIRAEQLEPIVKSRLNEADAENPDEDSDDVATNNQLNESSDVATSNQLTITATNLRPYQLSDPPGNSDIYGVSENSECGKKFMDKTYSRRAFVSQCLINAVIMTIVTAGGMPIGFSAVLLPQLQSNTSTLPTDDDWASWIASIHSTAAPIGSILAGPMMDKWGRRTTLHLALIPIMAGWSLMSLAPNHYVLLVGRFLAGFSVGMIPGPSQILISEISDPSWRGLFSSMPSASYAFGILLVYLTGSSLEWRIVAALGTVLPVFAAIALFFLPESPVWLVNKNRSEDARNCLLLLRGRDEARVNNELHALIGHNKMEKDKEARAKLDYDDTMCAPVPRCWDVITRPQVFKPFLIIFTFCTLQILSGSYIAIFYGVSLISSASGTDSQNYNCLFMSSVTALVRFIVSIITSICLLKVGRRKIGMISGIGSGISCLLLVIFLYVRDSNSTTGSTHPINFETYVIGGFIMVYVAMNTFGIFSLPVMMIGEVLPSNIRGRASGLLLMLINLMIFSTTKVYPSIAAVLGSIGIFTAFMIVSFVIVVYVYLFLPETRDRPLTQIEEYFANDKHIIWPKRDKELTKRCNV